MSQTATTESSTRVIHTALYPSSSCFICSVIHSKKQTIPFHWTDGWQHTDNLSLNKESNTEKKSEEGTVWPKKKDIMLQVILHFLWWATVSLICCKLISFGDQIKATPWQKKTTSSFPPNPTPCLQDRIQSNLALTAPWWPDWVLNFDIPSSD